MIKSIFFLSVVMTIAACNSQECSKDSKSCCSKDAATTDITTTTPTTTESVFDITNIWKTQNETALQLSQLAGKITVAAMVFTHCEAACPRIVADIQRIESALSAEELKQVSFVLITMDPLRDTPARLKEFAAEHQLGSNWTLLTANEDETMVLANVLNVRMKKLSSGGFDHSNTIFVWSQTGAIAHHQDGLAVEPTETLASIRNLITPTK